MNDEPQQPSVIAWYRSPVFVNLIVSVIMQLMSVLHVAQWAEADVSKLVDLALQIAAIAFAAYAAWKRKHSTVQPLALTKAGAENASAQASEPTIPKTEIPK